MRNLTNLFLSLLILFFASMQGCGDASSPKGSGDTAATDGQSPVTDLPYIVPPVSSGDGPYYNVLKDRDTNDSSDYTLYEYNENNYLVAIKSYVDNLLEDTVRYEYDDTGKITKQIVDSDGDGDADAYDAYTTYEYAGNILTSAHFFAYFKGVGWIESSRTYTYVYFGSGGIQINTYRDDELVNAAVRVYDDSGNLIYRYEDADFDGEYERKITYTYLYDAYGNTVKMTDGMSGKTYLFEYANNGGVTYGYYPVFGLNPLEPMYPVVNKAYRLTKITEADSNGTVVGTKEIIWETEEPATEDPGTEEPGTEEPETTNPCDTNETFAFSVDSHNYGSEIWVSNITPASDPSQPTCAMTLYWVFDNGYTYSGGGVDSSGNETPGIAPSVSECNMDFNVTGTWENNATYTTAGIWSYSLEGCSNTGETNTTTLSRDAVNEIVIDTGNNLMWEDTVETKTVIKVWAEDIKYATTEEEYYDTSGDTAATYCEELAQGGYTDWRLPTTAELLILSSYPDVETLFVYYSPNNDYWTSETNTALISNAYTVVFPDGEVGDLNKGKKANFRCVRDITE